MHINYFVKTQTSIWIWHTICFHDLAVNYVIIWNWDFNPQIPCLHRLGELYKLLNSRTYETRNGMGIVVERDLKDKIVNVKRIRDKILSIKLHIEKEIVHTTSTYAL